jgi:hypothetical protein
MAKVPSPEWWRRYVDVEVTEVNGEGTFSRMLEKVCYVARVDKEYLDVEVTEVDDKGSFSRLLEKVILMSL